MSPKAVRNYQLVGWREWVSLPELGVASIKAKIDTGAKTSAIHAYRVRRLVEGGAPHVSFDLHPVQRRRTPVIRCVSPLLERRPIRSSNGAIEQRYVIETLLVLGDTRRRIQLTLTDRDAMSFRMLLGRDALRRTFAVIPGASYLQNRTVVT